ncbi:cupin domain-containing protein [Photobacterium sp. DNB23_23_1]|uniref:Cupin domain-containing protein n=1 Tax=Photobacterium pectinilyticum TaxID=2906793 RepID=A0ABT1N3B9_9GAMM|nr:cupin domain-containing protein [Photobacterium sp. ZSDE20]MCQ1059240.1 cupin domain-containing protein [Photobacterium sp. ZSDE20]MDD1824527.1 cupin domain-containing protein [Photobacterium sp. ZSDE20]
MDNLFAAIPSSLPDELFEDIVNTDSVRVERIVSRGHVTPEGDWYDQEECEWVMVMKGGATILFEEGMREVRMEPGDHLNIPAHQRHRVSWTDPAQDTIWLAVFYSGH